jgi:hypothetical protein
MRFKQILFLFISIVGLLSATQAQIPDKEIVIEKAKEIKLKPASKNIDKAPTIKPPKDTQGQNYTYSEPSLDVQNLTLQPDMPDIAQEAHDEEVKIDHTIKAYLRGGYGNYRTSYLEGFLQHQLSEQITYGVHAKHLASQYGSVLNDYSGTNHHLIHGFAKYFAENTVIQADLGYQQNVYHFYGHQPAFLETLDKNDIKQKFKRTYLNLNYSHTNPQNLRYEAGVHIKNLRTALDVQEQQLGLDGKVFYPLSQLLGIQTELEAWFTQRKDTEKINRNLAQLKSFVKFQGDKINLQAGLNVAYENDSLRLDDDENKDIHLYPVFKASYQLLDPLRIYAGWEGGIQRTTLDAFAQQNPFLDTQVLLLHTNQRWEASAGVKGNLKGNLSYHVGIQYGKYQNLPFFINNPTDTARFIMAYQGNESSIAKLQGELQYIRSEKIQARVQATFYQYSLPTFAYTWHQPNFTLNINSIFKPIDKLTLNLDYYVLGGIDALASHSTETIQARKTLGMINDLSIKGEYLFFNNFSVFLHINNVLNQKYQRYLNYPHQGINFLMGLSYAFGR